MATLAPDPRNVRDALLEAGYTLAEVERMLRAASGIYITASEKRHDQELSLQNPEDRPHLIASTWHRIGGLIGVKALELGHIEREETREGDIAKFTGTLWVLANK